MAHILRIKKASKETLIADNTPFLDVEVELVTTEVVRGKEKEVVTETRKFGYPLGTSQKDIEADLSTFLVNYEAEQAAAVEDRARQAEHDAADETITNLTGVEINHVDASKKARKGS